MLTAKQVAKKKKARRPVLAGDTLDPRVRELRESMGLSLTDVSRSTGIHKSVLSRLERGFDLQVSTALRLSRFFESSIEELWPSRQPKAPETAK